jgi:hypothetical protein
VPELPLDELERLADQLQHHLFGGGGDGEVSLLLFEGSSDAVQAFAALSAEEVAAAIVEPGRLPPGGRLMRLRPGANPVVIDLGRSLEPGERPHPPARSSRPAPRLRVGVLGAYLLSREIFIGDTLAVQPADGPHHFTVTEDEGFLPPDEAEFDALCLAEAARILTHKAGGLPLGVPLAYSNFVRGGQANRLQEMLALLPKNLREQLNASVYGVPRHLPYGAAALHTVLDPHFGSLSLITSDPGFEVEQLSPHSVASLTFCLREHEPHVRQGAIRAFARHGEAYRSRGVRQVLANVRSRAELELAAQLGLHIVSGPAVCGFLEAPIGGKAVRLSQLPLYGRGGPVA